MIKGLFSLTIVRTYLIFQLLTRVALSAYAFFYEQIKVSSLPGIFITGLINDLVSLSYFLPILLAIIILAKKLLWNREAAYRLTSISAYFMLMIVLSFISLSELVFWDEFGSRFNFIAVDYLVYSNEIIGTLQESMPVKEVLSIIFIAALAVTVIMRPCIYRKILQVNTRSNTVYMCISLVISILAFNFYNSQYIHLSKNRYARELGRNGPYEFFSAFWNNSLNYNVFYPTIQESKAISNLQNMVVRPSHELIGHNIDRLVVNNPSIPVHKYNVVLITVESLSAKFMTRFGQNANITPYLDEIAKDSILFTNIYATGTRTVRGLEAITLSVPPTPGSSIIRRPDNQNLFNIGSVFKNEGYDVNFIFGGYSYFDNLQSYFTGNGYKIIDRGDLSANEISFSNIWGVADEDILSKSLEAADESHAKGSPFFSLIMTTSNHRPYTFPDNRVDLPSGGGRAAAVKYTDYAIGQFIEKAKTKPWFDKTIFVITADHCASSAGKADLPIDRYHIPLMIYAPNILKQREITDLASQIDIAPTIFGLLNFEYESKFFGADILKYPPNRAFISTYQLLGLIKNGHLVVLAPNENPRLYKVSKDNSLKMLKKPSDMEYLIEDAISFYQSAYYIYTNEFMKDFDSEE